MQILKWLSEQWFELFQTIGIVAGLFFSNYALRRDEQARRISSLNAIKQDYLEIWNKVYERPELVRVLNSSVDLDANPITTAEWLFIKLLVLHLDSVHRAIKAGLFVSVEGLQKDIEEFFKSPIPKVIWEKMKPLQDKEFVRFVEDSRK